MTNEEARRILIQNTESLKANPLVTVDDCLYEAFDVAIKALEQTELNPSYNSIKTELDCINRTELTQKLNAWDSKAHGIPNYAWKVIREMPSVYPERPKGKWIKYKVDIAPHPLHCSLCGFSNHHISDRYIKEFRRCPNCGAEMDGGEADDK